MTEEQNATPINGQNTIHLELPSPSPIDIAVAARKLALDMGADTVIIMVSKPDGATSSAFGLTTYGREFTVRGLLDYCTDEVRKSIKFNADETNASPPGAAPKEE